MAAYMRKAGILPVCTNNEARAYFAGKGLTYADVTEGDILTLVMLLNKHIKKANADCETSMGSMYLSRRIDLKRKTNGTLISCFLYVNSHYFERRECISFNADGWIGFAGWADQGKACPGQYLYDRHGAIAAAVNELLGSGTTQPPEAAPGAVQGLPATPFTVRVIIPDLNYRKGPGMSYAVRGQTGKGVFTITEVQDGWGKLKSGAGWIYLENPDYCTIQGVAAKPAEPDPADVLAQEIAGKVKGSGLDPADVLNRVEKILGVA